ncbi:hypothetical protein F5884DRAFT_753882 [Xylogone sp. PMI_703]|nr:hypothetical protein F5884DRAFT_753882 [Xylogone sp. PMI_703]
MLFSLQRRQHDQEVAYEPLADEKNQGDVPRFSKRSSWRGSFWDLKFDFWALLSCVLAATTIVLSGLLYRQHLILSQGSSFENGFETDLAPARPAVKLVDLRFTGELAVENGKWIRRINYSMPQYAGPPSDAIDKAWAVNIDLEGDEAKGLEDTWIWPGTDKHYTGFTVHHTLHCVNMLRMAIYKDYYLFPDDIAKREFTWIHLDHCIDFIRQAVQCHADLTPMRWYWSEAVDQAVLKAESPHTCRKWDNIQKWAMDRIHVLSEAEKAKIPPRPPHGSWSP